MRSRFAAYALGRADHIVATTDPTGPQWQADEVEWIEQIRRFSETTRFEGLALLDSPEPEGDEGFVTFEATLEQGGRDASFSERSRFRRVGGRWLYHSGERLSP